MMQFTLAAPVVGEAEIAALVRAVQNTEISRGPAIAGFEAAFSAGMDGGDSVSTANGTCALELAVRALGLAGQSVVTGAMSCQATANALLAAGCKIAFADHDPQTWQVSPDAIIEKLGTDTRAVVVAHLYGSAADLTRLSEVCAQRRLLLIEDCSQSFGARSKGRRVGSFGDAATFSFYGNKLITTGEGGMMWTRHPEAASRARMLRNHGQDRPFHHVEFGLNWKMPNLLAALGVEQLRRVPELIRARQERYRLLRTLLAGHPAIQLPAEPEGVELAPFCFPLLTFRHNRDEIAQALADSGVETRPLFAPQSRQPYWSKVHPAPAESFPVAEELSRQGLYISTSPHLSLKECEQMAQILVEALDAQAPEHATVDSSMAEHHA
jgi:perosamine synthetase